MTVLGDRVDDQRDLGTPAVDSESTVTVLIDGVPVDVPTGTSVMRAAALSGTSVPKLCATDSLEAFGSCRLCLVEIDGKPGTPASCTTPCIDGMSVKTQTPKLDKLRKGVMELYISDHPLDCLTCPANGDCELQDMAGIVGLRDVRYGMDGMNHLDAPKDESNPYFSFDESKCIACSRCVRACSEVQGTFALTIAGRGDGARGLRGAPDADVVLGILRPRGLSVPVLCVGGAVPRDGRDEAVAPAARRLRRRKIRVGGSDRGGLVARLSLFV